MYAHFIQVVTYGSAVVWIIFRAHCFLFQCHQRIVDFRTLINGAVVIWWQPSV